MASVEHTKDTVRQAAFSRRVQMPLAERKVASEKIVQSFLQHVPLPQQGGVISGYSPINAEVDIRPLMAELRARGYRIALPQVGDREGRLVFRAWDEDKTPMRISVYGIPEPEPATAEELIPDLLIMPGLAFDLKGNRVGYGSGFFDRSFEFLKKIQPFFTAGVAFETQVIDDVPIGIHDYPMDMLITEKHIHDFRGKKS